MNNYDTIKIDLINRALSYLAIDGITSLVHNNQSEPLASVLLHLQNSISRVLASFVFSWSYKIIKLVQYNDDYKGYIIPPNMLTYLGIGDNINCCCGSASFPNFLINTHRFNISTASIKLDKSRTFETRLQIDSCCMGLYCYQYLHYISSENDYDQLKHYPFLEEYIVCELAYSLSTKLIAEKSTIHQQLAIRLNNAKKSAFKHETVSYTNKETCRYIPFFSVNDTNSLF